MLSFALSLGLACCLPVAEDTKQAEQPEASKMLADARIARATISNFPGFTADVVLTMQGKQYRGVVQVDSKGKVVLGEIDGPAASWARRVLASAVAHRLQNSAQMHTPCAFADEDKTNPLGRLVNVLNDEMHSSYRIRDNQIMVVNRVQDGTKFSITVQENFKNEEGKFLPSAYAVHTWAKDGSLEKTEAHTQGWTRINGLDLPQLIRVVMVGKEMEMRELQLEKIKLTAAK